MLSCAVTPHTLGDNGASASATLSINFNYTNCQEFNECTLKEERKEYKNSELMPPRAKERDVINSLFSNGGMRLFSNTA